MDHTEKPIWPHGDEYKLTPHMGSGQWCRKINGRVRYFGKLSDPDAALRKFLNFQAEQDATKAEVREPPTPADEITLHLAVNAFLTHRLHLVEQGGRSSSQYVKYRNACKLILETMGRETLVTMLTPADFKRLRGRLEGGPVHITNQIVCIRAMFNWAENEWGFKVRYGSHFSRPGKRQMLAAKKPRTLWTPQDIRAVLSLSSPALRCFILLGINCAFGQKDCAYLPLNRFNLEGHDFPRPKNGNRRTCPFWPETIAAIADYIRPAPAAEYRHLTFITRFGNPWVQERVTHTAAGDILRTSYNDSISQELDKLCDAAGVHRRPFYDLRHTFYSVADEAGDPTARDAIMGHTLPGMKEVYSHLLANRMQRLKVVTKRVHDWLFTE